MDKTTVGRTGESIAAAYLLSNGYTIIERNFKRHCGEIDIISQKDDTIVFVEVKFRRNATGFLPREAVTKKQRGRIRAAANVYVSERSETDERVLSMDLRCDVIEIIGLGNDGITHIEGAF